MRFVRPGVVLALLLPAFSLLAQTSIPTLIQGVPAQTVPLSGAPLRFDLREYFALPGVTGTQFVQFDTSFGRFNVELRNDIAPRHVANFLAYVSANDYANSFFHRSTSFEGGATSIVQGGGYRLPLVTDIARRAAVALEYNLANVRGTLAAARTTDVNSATSEWFFNTRDNSTILGPTNNSGYSVFGRVLGTGMSVVDQIAALPRVNASGTANPDALFGSLPVRNFSGGQVSDANVVVVNSIRPVVLFPNGTDASVIEFTAESSTPDIVRGSISRSTLVLTPIDGGTGNVIVRATDINGNTAQFTVTVTVTATTPVFVTPPASQTVAAGSTAVFNAFTQGAARYRWERNGVAIPDATTSTLVIPNASPADAGAYTSVAINSAATARSQPATLTVANVAPADAGRLVNLSILTVAGSGAKVLTMGAFVGPGDLSGALPLVIRAVGPTLAQPPFNVSGVLPDPVMTFYAAGNSEPIDSNDNWGGGAALAAAFRAVAAFELPAASLDSAIVRNTPGVATGGYTVQVTGKNDASGSVIAEMYDASGSARTATTPRLINLSTRAEIDNGAELAVGFVLGGLSSRTVLVRGVGPSLAVFGVTGVMGDPKLELFNNNTGQRIGSNDDWSGNVQFAAAAAGVGAFALANSFSRDAVMLVTLPPGPYSARISGADGFGGVALVEVYEVP